MSVLAGLVTLSLLPSAAHAAGPNLHAPGQQVERIGAVASGGVRFQRYQQEIDGVPVIGSQATVTDAPGSRGDLLIDRTRSRLPSDRPSAAIAGSRAIELARDALGVRSLRGPEAARLALLPESGGVRLVWRVTIPSRDPLASFEALIDARSGELVRSRNLLQHFTGSANVFDPNPVVTQGSTSGLSDSNDADSVALTNLRQTKTLERLDASTCLSGQWVQALRGPGDTPVCRASRDWTDVTRHDPQFEALMAYFHLDREQSYIQLLGFTNVMNRQIVVHTDATTSDNSFFDALARDITTGTGGVDDAEDAEVIEHEYGHAIQDDQVPGFGFPDEDSGAIGEGFGDYISSAMSATFTPNPTFDPCFAEWDTLGSGDTAPVPCLRRVDGTQTVSQGHAACGTEVHCMGEVWSGALWAIRNAIGGATADRLVIQSHFSLTQDPTFNDASR
ncbi:MAG TPA: M36 family metallopeptidase, partial [Thermoleophilaceae bacterium]